MKYFLSPESNANTDITIYGSDKNRENVTEITEQQALELLYKEVDESGEYPISDYKLIYSDSLGRYGITYKTQYDVYKFNANNLQGNNLFNANNLKNNERTN